MQYIYHPTYLPTFARFASLLIPKKLEIYAATPPLQYRDDMMLYMGYDMGL